MKEKIKWIILGILLIIISFLVLLLFNNKKECINNIAFCEHKIEENKQIKYVFLFVGDGMSNPQIELTEGYMNSILNKYEEQLSFSNFSTIGLRKNNSADSFVTDSAASASALASGTLINNYSLNIDSSGSILEPITYKLKKQKNMKIGIMTTVGINHATPAAFYAKSSNRTDYQNIFSQLLTSDFDYFAGSQILDYNDNNLDDISKSKYELVNTDKKFNEMSNGSKYIVLNKSNNSVESLKLGIDQKGNDFSLEKYVEKAIEVLDNESGFFIMAESGMIDYAGHNNDAVSIISETLELNKAVIKALAFANEHPSETLIIVTGDHETGGLSLGSSPNYKVLESQKISYVELDEYGKRIINENISFENVLNYLKDNCGLNLENGTSEYDSIRNAYSDLSNDQTSIRRAIVSFRNNQAGITFTTQGHTGLSVPVYVYGDKNNSFAGVYNSADFNKTLQKVLGLK